MAQPELKRMSVEAFLDWQLQQDKLYELVDGLPYLPLKMMTGASRNHDRITVNTILSLGNQLRGKPCQPSTDDIAVRIPAGNVRRPDVLVDCGAGAPKDITASEPRVVVEVLSPSTLGFDRFRKLEEYKTVASLSTILLIDTEAPQITVYRRREREFWQAETVEGLEAVIALPEIEAALPLRDLYQGVVFAEPRM
jgi:Uma2 family endonuclease